METTKSKYTPGPWETDGYNTIETRDDETGKRSLIGLAFCADDNGPCNSEGYANARLMSAAPELAEALAKLVRMADDTRYDTAPSNWSIDARLSRHEKLRKARAALAKAGVL